VQNDEETVCDILTEIISTLFKMYSRLLDKQDRLKVKIAEEQNEESKANTMSAKNAATEMLHEDDEENIPEKI